MWVAGRINLSAELSFGLMAEHTVGDWVNWLKQIMVSSKITVTPSTVLLFGETKLSPGQCVKAEDEKGQLRRFVMGADSSLYPADSPNKAAQCTEFQYVRLTRDSQGDLNWMGSLHRTYWEIYRRLLTSGSLPLHGGFAELNGTGVLISGPSGCGKSTCCANFPASWQVHSDDETLAVSVPSAGYRCHPFPTISSLNNGHIHSWDVSHCAPLKAVFFIEHSDHDTLSRITDPLTATVLFHDVSRQVFGRVEEVISKKELEWAFKKILENAGQMAREVPAYRLGVKLGGNFYKLIEDELNTIIRTQ